MGTTSEKLFTPEFRRTGLGGSDGAAALGEDPYKTPLQLFLEKTGEIEPDDLSEKENVQFGTLVEDAIAEMYERKTGRTLWKLNETLRCDKYPFMFGHIDRRVVNMGYRRGFEAKNVNLDYWRFSDEWGEAGSADVPVRMLIQCNHYMYLYRAEVWDLAACVGGNSLHVYEIPRDEELIELIVEGEAAFWNYVETDTRPPLALEHPSAPDLIKKLYPGTTGETIQLDDRTVEIDGDTLSLMECRDLYKTLGPEIKEREKLREAARLAVLDAMGEAAIGVFPDGTGVKRTVIPGAPVSYTRKEYVRASFTNNPLK